MFELLGDAPDNAKTEAECVLATETSLATGALNVVKRRDPNNIYHKMTRAELVALGPNFGWEKYFTAIDPPTFTSLNVSEPDFIKNLNGLLQSVSLEDWKTYLRWHAVHANAAVLPEGSLRRILSSSARRCKEQKNNHRFGNAVYGTPTATWGGRGPEICRTHLRRRRQGTNAQNGQHHRGFAARGHQTLSWMTDETKAKALEKLAAITNRIGYPDNGATTRTSRLFAAMPSAIPSAPTS